MALILKVRWRRAGQRFLFVMSTVDEALLPFTVALNWAAEARQ
jgi:hypothetical protein